MNKQWQRLICIGLALITVTLTATACPSPGGQTDIPVIEFKRVAPNNLDLAGNTVVELATPSEGAVLVNGDLRLWVPPGAVSKDTPVTVKLYNEYPEFIPPTVADAPVVNIISELYDLGPDSTTFSKPVKITMPYYEASLPTGTDENNIGVVYFDGQNWVAVQGLVDTVKNTVSFETKSFPGFSWALFLPATPAQWVLLAGLTVVSVAAWSYATPAIKSQVVKDPIYYNKASQYITPYNSVVMEKADMARIYLDKDDESKYVQIKDMLGDSAILEKFAEKGEGKIGFFNGSTTVYTKYKTIEDPNDWQMPKDYFTNGMIGDCKNVANAMASIFRSYGYPVKCVDGEASGGRHVWAEVLINGKAYYVGDEGEIMPLDEAISILHLTRPQGDGKNQMWDEKGQQPYKENWWSKLRITVDSTMAFPGGEVYVEVFGAAGTALEVEVILETSAKVESPYSGVTDAATGVLGVTWTLDENAPTGTYWITATNKITGISELELFTVDVLKVSATIEKQQVAPGEQININVKLNYPLDTAVEVEQVNYSWTTNNEGNVRLTLNVPEGTEFGTYTLTIKVPEFKLATQVKYIVTTPPTMTVSVSPKEVAPGGKVKVNIKVQPGQVTRITIRGYSGSWNTDKNGVVSPELTISSTASGEYEVVVDAPDLKLIATDTFNVTATPGQEIGLSDINVGLAQLTINADGEDEDSYFTMRLVLGGSFIRVSALNGNEIIATGSIPTGFGQGELYYSFTLNKDLTMVTSGTISMLADTGEYYNFNVANIPMNTDYEDKLKAEKGLNALVFSISGAAVSGHFGNVDVNEPSLGTFSRYFAADDSEILIILVAATESQMTELLD